MHAWQATREPLRVRCRLVDRPGFRMKDGTRAIGFAKLRGSVYGDEHVAVPVESDCRIECGRSLGAAMLTPAASSPVALAILVRFSARLSPRW